MADHGSWFGLRSGGRSVVWFNSCNKKKGKGKESLAASVLHVEAPVDFDSHAFIFPNEESYV